LSFLLMQWARVGLILGASGATLGVTFAFAWYWPKYPVFMFPLPDPIPRWLVTGIVAFDLVLAWAGALTRAGVSDPIAHLAHLGGVATRCSTSRANSGGHPGERRDRQMSESSVLSRSRRAPAAAVPCRRPRVPRSAARAMLGQPPRSIACSIRSTRAASRASRLRAQIPHEISRRMRTPPKA